MNSAASADIPGDNLDPGRLAQLARAVEGLTPVQLYWVAAWSAAQAAQSQRDGASAALPGAAAPVAATADAAIKAAPRLTIVYGSQTGNAKRIAEQLAGRSEAAGVPVRLLRADAYPQGELAQERHLALVISTQGEGEPPDDARGLFEFIAGKRAPKLPSLQFAVLGLGDSTYPQFCVIGRQLDARFAELGGNRITGFGEADVEFETVAAPWTERVLEQTRDLLKPVAPSARVTALHAVPSRNAYSREQPFAATVLANQRIVARESERDVRHLELSLKDSGLRYQSGDALGVWPHNPASLVEQWLDALRLDGAQEVSFQGRSLPLRQWLRREREITRLTRPFIAALAAASGHGDLMRMLRPEHALEFAALLASDQPIDLLRRYPSAWQADALIGALRALAPRLYSIASSPKAVDDEVHLTVAVVEYEARGETHWGAASTWLAATGEDGKLSVFIEPNERFRLPEDGTRDIIMIGPGTGVAPFRAFVQERRESGASGRNWLFFGNRHFARDFLYQLEWQQALKDGSLHRLDLAFSRDGPEKIYVQDRLREHGAQLYAWLCAGAHLYVCGDSAHMARDVNQALLEIIATHGDLSAEDAKAWLAELLQQGRYARDVY